MDVYLGLLNISDYRKFDIFHQIKLLYETMTLDVPKRFDTLKLRINDRNRTRYM